jgi:PAS domain S-box-containing protein
VPRRARPDVPKSAWAQYALACAAVGAATLLRLPFEGWLQGRAPYGLYFPVLVAVAWRCGMGATALAALLSFLAAAYFFVPNEPGYPASTAVYALTAGALILLARGASRSHREQVAALQARGNLQETQRQGRESALRLAEIVASAMDAIVTIDETQRIVLINPAAERMFGRASDEVVGRPIDILIPERFRAVHREHVESFARSGQTIRRMGQLGQVWGLRASGEEFPVEASISQLRAQSGALLTVILRDVTELRAAEAKRQESESRLAGIVASAMDAIVTTDESQRVVVFNPAAERMFGRTGAEIVGRPIDVLIPERFRDAHREHMQRFARSGQTSRRMGQLGRIWGLRADGEEFLVEASISQTASESGTLLTAILRDVTERERAAATSALLASIVRSSDDAIVATDLEGRILSWNPAAQQMFGREQQQIEGSGFADLIAPERRAEIEAVLERARQGQLVDALETEGLRRDASRFPAHLAVSTRREGAAAVVGTLLIVRDVSERRNLERRLRQTEELAALATLVTGIAHDIGTPMNVILGYTDMLTRSLRDEKDRERLGIIKHQVERVTRLIQTLMNFARPQREAHRQLRVEDVAERALGLITETARKRGVAIERSFADTAPILAQGERLERALLDLFVNACDAMAQGGVLRVATLTLADGVEIRVEDTGVGIAPDSLGRIFEPFYTTKPRGKGTGLGLLVTRSIVLDHGGTIEVESEVGKGTAFVIRLPGRSASAARDGETAG